MFYYITQKNGNWNYVEQGPFSSTEDLRNQVVRMAESVSSYEDAIILSSCEVVGSSKRIRKGKNINNAWISGRNMITESQDPELRELVNNAINRF